MTTLEYICNKHSVPDPSVRAVKLPIGREELAALFGELGFTVGVEIGVERGGNSERLCKANPRLRLHCVDAWTAYDGYRDHANQGKLTRYAQEAAERLAPYNCNIIKAWSTDAVKQFPDGSLDFCYIDGNHDFLHVSEDITYWSDKVRKGGIVAGHDYVAFHSSIHCHVKQVVDAWCCAFRVRPLFIVEKGDHSNPSASWFWVKE